MPKEPLDREEQAALDIRKIGKFAMNHKSPNLFKDFLESFPTNGTQEVRLNALLESVYKTACDPKNRNQGICADMLLKRAYGNPKAADEDLAAIRKGGLTVVYVNRPAIDTDIPEALPQLEAKNPEFIEAEFPEEDR